MACFALYKEGYDRQAITGEEPAIRKTFARSRCAYQR